MHAPGIKPRHRRGELESTSALLRITVSCQEGLELDGERAPCVSCDFACGGSLSGSAFPPQQWGVINILHTVQRGSVTYQKPY